MWTRREQITLDSITPQEWINIPMPVRDSLQIFVDNARGMMDRLNLISSNFSKLSMTTIKS